MAKSSTEPEEVKATHSSAGAQYLKEYANEIDEDILDGVRYHHAREIREANLPPNSIAYLVYMADNIASATERRENYSEDLGFDSYMPLASVFNVLNGNNKDYSYSPYRTNLEKILTIRKRKRRNLPKNFTRIA